MQAPVPSAERENNLPHWDENCFPLTLLGARVGLQRTQNALLAATIVWETLCLNHIYVIWFRERLM